MHEQDSDKTLQAWPERDRLFRTVFRSTYGSMFNDEQLESLRKSCLDHQDQAPARRALMIGKVFLHGMTPNKINEKVEQSLKPLTEEQKRATKLVIGYHPEYCETGNVVATKEDRANQLGITIEELDILLNSAITTLAQG